MNFLTDLVHLHSKKILLASSSPRRREMLRAVGLKFNVQPAAQEKSPAVYRDPVDYVSQTARSKAAWVWEHHSADLVIAADTVVVKDGRIFEKPRDRAEAREILRTLSGATHQVVSGLCLRSVKGETVDHEITAVTFYPLSEREIELYLDTGESYDKAGGYGIQGLGAVFIEKVSGCYFNVVGFPVGKFYQRLRSLKL